MKIFRKQKNLNSAQERTKLGKEKKTGELSRRKEN